MQRGLWWQTGVIYQIYPRSFQDTDGDGIGDLRGITQRLPYLLELGVDAIWLSPIFPSPMADFGYDISDYTDIDPLFGSLDDFDALVAAAHAQGLKVILDLVPNHTSDRHPWFLESRASRRGRKRDWYIWKDPAANGEPPNNWLSVFKRKYSLAAPFGRAEASYHHISNTWQTHGYRSSSPLSPATQSGLRRLEFKTASCDIE
jgi:alpha-glucosidase